MSQCNLAILADRAVVRVAGPGARAFLQGMITNDINKAGNGAAIHTGLLAPQGKILFDFFAVPEGDGYLLECGKAQASALVQRLLFYRLRAQVEIKEEPSFIVAAAWGEAPRLPEGAIAYADPRLPSLGLRILLPSDARIADLGCAARPRSRLPCKADRAGRARGRTRLRPWRCLSARCPVRSVERRRLQERLLCGPGGRVAHGAQRHGAETHCRRRR